VKRRSVIESMHRGGDQERGNARHDRDDSQRRRGEPPFSPEGLTDVAQ
jgi:hypothetical protein